jgi:small subunit ribosomal protein S12
MINKKRNPKKRGLGSPQLKGVCLQVFETSPKKPNSGNRKVCRVRLSNGSVVSALIPGGKQDQRLQKHSVVLLRGGRSPDLPGVKFKLIRGTFDLTGIFSAKQARSKKGTKKRKK